MDWKRYSAAVLLFSLVGFVFVYLLQRIQGMLPLNPADMGAVETEAGLQYRRQLRHQHQLAGLRRRSDA